MSVHVYIEHYKTFNRFLSDPRSPVEDVVVGLSRLCTLFVDLDVGMECLGGSRVSPLLLSGGRVSAAAAPAVVLAEELLLAKLLCLLAVAGGEFMPMALKEP